MLDSPLSAARPVATLRCVDEVLAMVRRSREATLCVIEVSASTGGGDTGVALLAASRIVQAVGPRGAVAHLQGGTFLAAMPGPEVRPTDGVAMRAYAAVADAPFIDCLGERHELSCRVGTSHRQIPWRKADRVIETALAEAAAALNVARSEHSPAVAALTTTLAA